MQNVRLLPDTQTQQLLMHYKLLPHQQAGKYSLYYMGPNSVEGFLTVFQQALVNHPMTFYLITEGSDFFIISDLPTNWCGQLQYSSQRQASSSNALTLQLSEGLPFIEGAVGKVEIHADLFQPEQALPHHLQIKMKARKTHWNYYIHNRSNVVLNNPMVSNLQGVEFLPGEIVESTKDEKVWLFKSGEMSLPMQEKMEHPFNLVSSTRSSYQISDDDKKRIVVSGLPLPNREMLNITSSKDKEYVCSDMYVYL